jgi:hypothetical protein
MTEKYLGQFFERVGKSQYFWKLLLNSPYAVYSKMFLAEIFILFPARKTSGE